MSDDSVIPSTDAMAVLRLLDQEGPDCDFEIIKRDGRIVNMSAKKTLRKELAEQREKIARGNLREPSVPVAPIKKTEKLREPAT